MKKLLFLLIAAFILAVPASAFAGDFLTDEEIAALEADEDEAAYSVLLNGTGFINFTAQQPINVEGRVYVPVRGVFENLGYEVDYDAETKTAVLTSSIHQIELTLGNEYFTVDNRLVYPETPQFILRGSFMIPLRAVAEAIGADVGYNQATRLITINYAIPSNTDSQTTQKTTTEATTEETTETAVASEEESVNLYFTISGTKYRFGQTKIPNPSKKMSSPFGFTWYAYSPNQFNFYMLGVNNSGEIVAFYAQTSSFSFENLSYGDTNIKQAPSVDGYTVKYYVRNSVNKLYNGKLYALFVCDNDYLNDVSYDEKTLSDVKAQLFTMLSAVRATEGQGIDQLENSYYTVSQQHTDDLAKNNGTATVSFVQKLTNTGVYLDMPKYDLYENSSSPVFYFDILDGILSNNTAYQALIYGGYNDIDMGLSYNETDGTLYYAHNIYISNDDYYSDEYNYR